MTLTSDTSRVQYAGNGTQTEFPITFVFWDVGDIQAVRTDTNGAETVWGFGTHYTLSGGSGSTGTLTVMTSPTDFTLASGDTLTITSNLGDTQDTSLPEGGAFPSSSVEQQLDKIVRLIQQKAEALGRAIKLPISSANSGLEIPDPSASKFLRWNAGASALENAEITGQGSIGIPVVVAEGGTGETTTAAARSALGAAATDAANTFTALQTLSSANFQFSDNELIRPVITDYGIKVNAIGSIGGGTRDIDLEAGNVVTATVDTSATTFTFSNPPASGTYGAFMLVLSDGGSQTITWPASVDWPNGAAPTLTASGVDILSFFTTDSGTIWHGNLERRNSS